MNRTSMVGNKGLYPRKVEKSSPNSSANSLAASPLFRIKFSRTTM